MPFSIVENEAFKEFVLSLNKDFKTPARNTLKTRISRDYFETKENIKYILREVPGSISLTTDCWTSISNHSFLSLTGHFLDKNWDLNTVVLDIDKIQYPHITEKVRMKICEELREKNVQISQIPFAAHQLNIAVKTGLERIGEKQEYFIANLRSLITSIRRSPKKAEEFYKIVDRNDDKRIKLKLDVLTRWNSTFDMLFRANSFWKSKVINQIKLLEFYKPFSKHIRAI